ncbi:MAG: ribosome small subunit-dependent GTPase A [Actinomycetes bacterium]|nr:ribosome small subunit-dependent GTPase A [Actinomycetes bacterium]MDX5381314.1 ribosome small subunit-dependent GTPase A [Actinomycetes bacterium]MDX5400707.1 ribosome small subunit-dependent GTPase A [Actinomycetes bacterium]MDX5451091.1 ribosome small subunit-dependent GTPase A [Actinomycetes bacterium]
MRDTGTDDHRVRVRPGRGSRPRTKNRPDRGDAPRGRVMAVDRGRYAVVTDDGVELTAVAARELGRRAVVVGDRVGVVGDLSGRRDTLARIVVVDDRISALRRSAEDGDAAGVERVVVANATQLVIVVSLADPPPRPRLVDRFLVAAYDAGMRPLLCLTKADLASPDRFLAQYQGLDLGVVVTAVTGDAPEGLEQLRAALRDEVSVMVGHSGVGKSTLVNLLVPGADRQTGDVNEVTGRGRHTSSSAVALPLPGGGLVIDTPGIRSFGLAHVQPEDLLRGFADLAGVAAGCPRGCTHLEDSPDCELDEWVRAATGPDGEPLTARDHDYRRARLASYRRLLAAR